LGGRKTSTAIPIRVTTQR